MVTKGTEVDLGTVDTLPADAVHRRGTAAITYYPLVLYPCASRGGGGGGCMVVVVVGVWWCHKESANIGGTSEHWVYL